MIDKALTYVSIIFFLIYQIQKNMYFSNSYKCAFPLFPFKNKHDERCEYLIEYEKEIPMEFQRS